MNRGWGQAPRAPEAPPGDLARHHEQAPPGPHQTRLHAVGNQTRLTNYVETRAGTGPQPLTKTTYEGACTSITDRSCSRQDRRVVLLRS